MFERCDGSMTESAALEQHDLRLLVLFLLVCLAVFASDAVVAAGISRFQAQPPKKESILWVYVAIRQHQKTVGRVPRPRYYSPQPLMTTAAFLSVSSYAAFEVDCGLHAQLLHYGS